MLFTKTFFVVSALTLILADDGTASKIGGGSGRQCIQKTNERISGPDACEVKPHSVPWIVDFGMCGGTLIDPGFVLTAAHCYVGKSDTAIVGQHDQNSLADGDIEHQIEKVISHPKYQYHLYAYDLALVKLKEPVQETEQVTIAKLPDENAGCPQGKTMIAAGWGRDIYNASRPLNKLHAVEQECVPLKDGCPRYTEDPNYIMCAGDKENMLNLPNGGDSGGPLSYTNKDGTTTIYGVVSGPGGRFPNGSRTGEIYVRVAQPDLLQWIKETMIYN